MKNYKLRLIAMALVTALFITSCGQPANDINNENIIDKGDLEIIDDTDKNVDKNTDNVTDDSDNKPEEPNVEEPSEEDPSEEKPVEEKPVKETPKSNKDNQKDDLEGENHISLENDNDQRDDPSAQFDTIKKLKVGQMIHIVNKVNIYSNAQDATLRQNEITQYPGGNYYVYRIVDNSINISNTENNPGGWMNPLDTVISGVDGEPVGDNDSNDSKNFDGSKFSGKAYSWSWAYPETSGAELLTNKNGYYKYNDNNVYLTFDNGYEYKNNTTKILDILKENNVKATFFVTSDFIKSHTAVVKRMVNEGHLVGNHSQKHLDHSAVDSNSVYKDLANWEKDFKEYIGKLPNTKAYRPPEGKFNLTSLDVANELNYKTILWAYAYRDWDTSNQPDVNKSLLQLVGATSGGDVVLLHAVSDTNVELLDEYISLTKAKGYNFSLIK